MCVENTLTSKSPLKCLNYCFFFSVKRAQEHIQKYCNCFRDKSDSATRAALPFKSGEDLLDMGEKIQSRSWSQEEDAETMKRILLHGLENWKDILDNSSILQERYKTAHSGMFRCSLLRGYLRCENTLTIALELLRFWPSMPSQACTRSHQKSLEMRCQNHRCASQSRRIGA